MSGIGIEILATTTLSFAIQFAEICLQMQDAPRSATTFARLFQQVERDLKHAEECREKAFDIFKQHPDFIKDWIIDSIVATYVALEHLEVYLRNHVAEKVDARNDLAKYTHVLQTNFMYVFEKDMLVDEENALKYAHVSLLTAINALHMMLLRPPQSK